jgi:hypothetical protein
VRKEGKAVGAWREEREEREAREERNKKDDRRVDVVDEEGVRERGARGRVFWRGGGGGRRSFAREGGEGGEGRGGYCLEAGVERERGERGSRRCRRGRRRGKRLTRKSLLGGRKEEAF